MKVMGMAKITASNQRAWPTLLSISFLPNVSRITAPNDGRSELQHRQDHCILRPDQGPMFRRTEAQPGNVCAADLFRVVGREDNQTRKRN
ncbi:hypothetical protein B5V01_13455 [Mesorhizobium erdmanii]|uniref:Uncharacterized protein n=1 Tax=Mesorhizobium erdmanii TaxID=1777866 RepID=A0A4Q1V8S5_9HYPH|nr:hypothetical protein B5V01_13455 [Mesorhizobium erdmanii]